MFCTKCGAQNEEGVKFCTNCGNPLTAVVQPVREKKPVDKKKLTMGIGIGAAALLLIIVISTMLSIKSSTIPLNDYLTIETKGYDGYGTLSYRVDWNKINEDYGKKVKFTSEAKKEYKGFLTLTTPVEVLADYVDVNIAKKDKLSNGDSIEYTWEIDEDAFKYVKFRTNSKSGSYLVSGLTKVESFDPFENIEVSYSGIAPSGTFNYSYNGDLLSTYSFSADKTYGLSNGDVITLSLDQNIPAETYINRYGKVPSVTSKTYTVEGLSRYMESYSDLSDSFLSGIKTDAEDLIISSVAQRTSNYKLSSLNFEGYIVKTLNSESAWGYYNGLSLIYSCTISSTSDQFSPIKVYVPVTYNSIIISDAEITYEAKDSVPWGANIPGTWNSVPGYINPKTMINTLENSEYYDYAIGGGVEVYNDVTDIKALTDIPNDIRLAIRDNLRVLVDSYIADNYSSTVTVSDLGFLDTYLLVPKTPGTYGVNDNVIYFVYAGRLHSDPGHFEDVVVYYPVMAYNLTIFSNGEFIYDYDAQIKGNCSIPSTGWHYYSTKGYIDTEDMFNKLVSANRDNYSYEVGGLLKQFGE